MIKLRKAILSLVIFLSYLYKEHKHPHLRNFLFKYRKLFTLLIVIVVSFLLVRCNTLPYSIEELIGNYKSILSEDQNKDPEKCKNPEDSIPPVNLQADLYAYYPFNGNADDATGNGHDATVVGATLTTDMYGNENSAYMFDGIDDYIIYSEMNDFPAGKVNRTITGWFKSSVTNPHIMMLFGFGAQKNTYNFQVGIGPEAIGSPIGQYRVNGWGDSFDWRTGVRVPSYLDGKWHHCAVTYDGKTTKIYFDGELKSETSDFCYITDPSEMVLVIGREIDLAGWEWEGALDEVRIYTKTLSADEIREMVPELPLLPQPQCHLYAFYPFNGNAKDESGNGHDASVFGAKLTTDRFGNENSAYMFDGIDDYIIYSEMNDFPKGKVNRTITGWFKSSVTNPHIMMLFGFGAQKNTYNFQVGIGPEAIGSSIGQYRVNGWGDSFDWRTGVKTPSYLDGEWHHCAVTYDGTTTKIYFDGKFINQTTEFTYTTDPENMVLVIGREIDLAGWEWNGELDDVRIYTCVIDEEEIRMLVFE